jgi:hypothetical protein
VTKIVSAQANCTFYEALRLLNERSGVEHLTLDEISAAVLDDSIRFRPVAVGRQRRDARP